MNPLLAHRSDSTAKAVNPDSQGAGHLDSQPGYVPTLRVLIRNMYPFAGSNMYPFAVSLFSNMYPFGGAKKDKILIRVRIEGLEVFSPGAPAWPGAGVTLPSRFCLEVWRRKFPPARLLLPRPPAGFFARTLCPDRAPLARRLFRQTNGGLACLTS